MGIELESEDFTIENIIKNVPIEKITTRGYVLLLILFSDSGFTDFNDNVYYESKMLFLPQGSLNRLHIQEKMLSLLALLFIFMVSHILEQCMMRFC